MSKLRPHRAAPHRLWAAWLAVLLTLFGALAPVLSHAMAQGGSVSGFEVCTTTGAKFIPADSPTGPESAVSLSHCPFCLHTTDRVAPPPHHLPYLFLDQGGQQEAPVWQAFFYLDQPYSQGSPRGPPAL
jgi:hypothetical protein